MNILIVEDEILLANSIKELLKHRQFDVELAADGETGLAYAELGSFDLIILDVMLPKLDGFQVASQLRAKHCDTPILMLTAKSAPEDRLAGLNAGVDYYLTKPFDTRELLACINAILRRQGGQIDALTFGNTTPDLSPVCWSAVRGRSGSRPESSMWPGCSFAPRKRTSRKKPFSPTSGAMRPTQWKTMWRCILAFSAKSWSASAPM